MTDGENNEGIDVNAWRASYGSLPDAVRNVHTCPIFFGDSSLGATQAIADLTGGKLFDAHANSLETIFKQIRGYQ